MINAMQHIGLGVWDVDKTYDFYNRFFGYKVKLNDLTVASKEMEPVVGSVETMRMMMAANPKGGGIIELIEHKSSPIRPFPENGRYGYYGVLEAGYGVRQIDRVVADMKAAGVPFLTPVFEQDLGDGRKWRFAYLQDPDGLPLQLTEEVGSIGQAHNGGKPAMLGLSHIGLGVSDLERSIEFYRNALGFDRVLFQFEGEVPEMEPVAGMPLRAKVAILERSQPASGPLGRLLPRGVLKLFEVKDSRGRHAYKGRRWGDIGCMEFCMDVTDLHAVVADMKAKGIPIYLPPVEIDMGSGSKGMVAYVRDPDGSIVEFVEAKSIAWLGPRLFMTFAMPLLRLYDRLSGG